jgi:hypothetical protein
MSSNMKVKVMHLHKPRGFQGKDPQVPKIEAAFETVFSQGGRGR